MAWASSQALHMVSFENFVKSMPPSLSELKVIPSFCFAFKIPDDRAVTTTYVHNMTHNGVKHRHSDNNPYVCISTKVNKLSTPLW